MSNHSDKALKTLEMMDTSPDAWKQADVKWVWEMRKVPGPVTCPVCLGNTYVAKDEAGNVIPPPQTKDFPSAYGQSYDYGSWSTAHSAYNALAQSQGRRYGYGCEKCRNNNPRARLYGRSTGKVLGLVEMEMWVGYIQWPAGTLFVSRFQSGCHCALCNKLVLKSNMVPTVGVRKDGQNLGMWVGADCAKKFLLGLDTYVTPDPKKGKEFVFDNPSEVA
jgi:hypothetical protein